MSARRVVVLGGTSEIALATVRELQRRSICDVALVGRDPAGLADAAAQLTQAGCRRVITLALDARDTPQHATVIGEAFAGLGGADIVLLAVGALGERGGLPNDLAAATELLEVNFAGAGSLLLHSASRLRDQGFGTLIVLSSVAGERIRSSNVVYGASKAGLDALAQGVGDALRADGVRVLVVRPGFVHTRMTKGLKPAPLSSTPSEVARVIADGLQRKSPTVWAPPPLRWVMAVLRILPRSLFRRLPL